MDIFPSRNACGNVICKVQAFLFRPHSINMIIDFSSEPSIQEALLTLYFLYQFSPLQKPFLLYPRNEVRGGYIGFTLSVCPSVRPLTFCVRPVASTVLDGFFSYLVRMISSMRGCVACDDPWPWPISSRSCGLDLENLVRSVASTVLDGFFLYFAQMITIIRGCVAWYVMFKIWKLEFLANLKKNLALTLKKNLQFSMDSFYI